MLTKTHCHCRELHGYNWLFLVAMSLCYGEFSMQIEISRDDCYDLCNLKAAGVLHSPMFFR